MERETIVILLLTVFTTGEGMTPLIVSIRPPHIHVNQSEDAIRQLWVTCHANQPITRCQFKFGNHAHKEVPTGIGNYSRLNRNTQTCHVNANRWGGISGKKSAAMQVGCRMKTNTSDWVYAIASLYISPASPLTIKPGPRDLVVDTHRPANVKVSSTQSLTDCAFFFGNSSSWTTSRGTCGETDHCYYGGGLDTGDCGVTLWDVREEHNGVFWFRLTGATGLEIVPVRLIVSKPSRDFSMGYTVTQDKAWLEARCSAIGGLPPAKLSWFLGDSPLEGGVASSPNELWVWPYQERNVTSRLRLRFTEEVLGQQVRCVAEYGHQGRVQVDAKTIHWPPPELGDAKPHSRTDIYVIVAVFIVLYAFILVLYDFTGERKRCCSSPMSFFRRESLAESDILDYHVTMTKRNVVNIESVQVPAQLGVGTEIPEVAESYFLPEPNRRISTKAERTLGLASKKEPSRTQNKWLPGRSQDDYRTPIYQNVAPIAVSDPVTGPPRYDKIFPQHPAVAGDDYCVIEDPYVDISLENPDTLYENMAPSVSEPTLYENMGSSVSEPTLYENMGSSVSAPKSASAQNSDNANTNPSYSNIVYPRK